MMTSPKTAAIAALALASTAVAAPRDIQMRSINFATGVIELHNFSSAAESVEGFRFCSHDEDQIRRYSQAMPALSIAAGESLYIHVNNDAPADPNRINYSSLGGNLASPFDQDAFAIQIYFPPVQFNNGNQIADHLQWSLGGFHNNSADERSDEAVNGGVWTDIQSWIVTTTLVNYIRLTDTAGGVLHSAANYETFDAMPDCNANGLDDFFEILDGTAQDLNEDGIIDDCQCLADWNADGTRNTGDFIAYLNDFNDVMGGDPYTFGNPDLASPIGTLNTSDFLAFLNIYNQGCP